MAEDVKRFFISSNHLCFEVTEKCNLNCYYCAYGKLYNNIEERGNRSMSFDLARSFIENYFKNDCISPKLNISFYGGEPLLNIQLIKNIVGLVLEHRNKPEQVTFSMTTNGTLLHEYVDFLVEHNFRISISLDGDKSANSYRVFHNNRDAYDTVIRNVNFIKDTYPHFFQNNISFMSVLHNRNSVEGILEYFHNFFNKESRISELSAFDIEESKKDEFNNLFKNFDESLANSDCERIVKQKKDLELGELSAFIRNKHNVVFHKYLNLIFEPANVKFPTATCLPFTKKIFITTQGNILPCEKIGLEHSFGLISKKGIEIDYSGIAKRYNDYYNQIKKQCYGCARVFACNHCFLYDGINRNKNFKCRGYSNPEQFKEYLANVYASLEVNPSWFKEIINEHIYE